MRLKVKLFLGFISILALLAISAALAWDAMRNMGAMAIQVQYVELGADQALQAQVCAQQYTAGGEPKLADNASEYARQAQKVLNKALLIATDSQKKRITETLDYLDEFTRLLGTINQKNAELKQAYTAMFEAQKRALDSLDETIARMEAITRDEFLPTRLDALNRFNTGRKNFLLARIAVRQYMTSPTPQAGDTALTALTEANKNVTEAADFIISKEMLARHQLAEENLLRYMRAAQNYIELRQALAKDEEAAHNSISASVRLLSAATATAAESFEDIRQKADMMLLTISAVAICLGMVVAFLIIRAINKPIREALAFASQVAGGDFSARWIHNSRDEMGALASGLNAAFTQVAERAFWYEGVLNAVPYGISVTDLDMHWTYANKAALRSLNKTSFQEIAGRHCSEKKGNLCDTPNCGIVQLRQGNNKVRFTNGEGKSFNVEMTFLHDMSGKRIGHVEISRDTTMEEDLRREAENAAARSRHEIVTALEGIVDHVSQTSERLSGQIEHSNKAAERVSRQIGETASDMEKMNSSVTEIAHNASAAAAVSGDARLRAEQGAAVVENVVRRINDVEQHSQQLKEDMGQLGQQARDIGTILNVISDIADQTNLLALNAAIEAARAGESGRGFAVVADEVRKLAEKTMQATVEVGRAIQAMQRSAEKNVHNVEASGSTISQANELVHQAGDSLRQIVALVEQSAEQVSAIASAADEQTSTSEAINQSLSAINNTSTESAGAMTLAAQAVADLALQTQRMVQLMENIKQGA